MSALNPCLAWVFRGPLDLNGPVLGRIFYLFEYARSYIEERLEAFDARFDTDTSIPTYTFGRRLRAVGVSFEDRQDLLGHRSSRVTTHYSAAELGRLIEAAEKVCRIRAERPELVVLRGVLRDGSRKTPASSSVDREKCD